MHGDSTVQINKHERRAEAIYIAYDIAIYLKQLITTSQMTINVNRAVGEN